MAGCPTPLNLIMNFNSHSKRNFFWKIANSEEILNKANKLSKYDLSVKVELDVFLTYILPSLKFYLNS